MPVYSYRKHTHNGTLILASDLKSLNVICVKYTNSMHALGRVHNFQ